MHSPQFPSSLDVDCNLTIKGGKMFNISPPLLKNNPVNDFWVSDGSGSLTYETIFVLEIINSDIVNEYSNYKRKILVLSDIYIR